KELIADVAVVEDLNGDFLTAGAFDLRSGQPLDLQVIRTKAFDPPFPSRDDLINGRQASGFLHTEHGVLMLAASPILDGRGQGPTHGTVVMGKLLSTAEVARISAQVQSKVLMSAPARGSTRQSMAQTAEVTQISQTYNDLHGIPVVRLTVELPRDITASGQSAVQYASMYLIGAAVLVVILLAVILNRVVLNPLDRMTRHAVELGRNEDLTTRLN